MKVAHQEQQATQLPAVLAQDAAGMMKDFIKCSNPPLLHSTPIHGPSTPKHMSTGTALATSPGPSKSMVEGKNASKSKTLAAVSRKDLNMEVSLIY
jgi:hypothetical protein